MLKNKMDQLTAAQALLTVETSEAENRPAVALLTCAGDVIRTVLADGVGPAGTRLRVGLGRFGSAWAGLCPPEHLFGKRSKEAFMRLSRISSSALKEKFVSPAHYTYSSILPLPSASSGERGGVILYTLCYPILLHNIGGF